MPERRQLLYISRLAPHTTPACVAEIVRNARQRNQAQGIGSLLVFDGLRFCQYLEGEARAVEALAERIRKDPRHTGFTLLHQGALSGPSLLGGRRFIYALCYDDSLDGVEQASGPQALDLLAGMLKTFDLDPGPRGA